MLARSSTHSSTARVTWFELFYDLVMVAAIAHGGHLLVSDRNFGMGAWLIGTFVITFVLWLSTSLAINIAPGVVPGRQSLMFVQMIAMTVANLSLSRTEGLTDNWGFAGLAVAFGTVAVIFLQVGRTVPSLRGTAGLWSGCAAGAAVILAVGILVPDDAANLAMVLVSLGVLVAAVPMLIWGVPRLCRDEQIEPAHLEERIGQFVIIVLGECFLGLVLVLDGFDSVPGPVIFLLAFLVAGALWAIFFTSVFPMGIPTTSGRLELWLLGVVVFLVGAAYSAEQFAAFAARQWGELAGSYPFVPLAAIYALVGALLLGWLGGAKRDARFARIHVGAIAVLVVVWLILVATGNDAGNLLLLLSSAVIIADALVCMRVQHPVAHNT